LAASETLDAMIPELAFTVAKWTIWVLGWVHPTRY